MVVEIDGLTINNRVIANVDNIDFYQTNIVAVCRKISCSGRWEVIFDVCYVVCVQSLGFAGRNLTTGDCRSRKPLGVSFFIKLIFHKTAHIIAAKKLPVRIEHRRVPGISRRRGEIADSKAFKIIQEWLTSISRGTGVPYVRVSVRPIPPCSH